RAALPLPFAGESPNRNTGRPAATLEIFSFSGIDRNSMKMQPFGKPHQKPWKIRLQNKSGHTIVI
ncbi:MAG: hypothetical protein N2A42_05890, partial [Luteolibacter sp.]